MKPEPNPSEPIPLKTDESMAAEILLNKEPPALARPATARPAVEPPTVSPVAEPPIVARKTRPASKSRSRRGLWIGLSLGAFVLLAMAGLGVFIYREIDDLIDTQFAGHVVRIPPGDYPLDDSTKTEKWGDHPLGSTFVPAYTIRGTPPSDDLFYELTSVSPGATVTRRQPGQPDETRDLEAALGSWVDLSVGADNLVWVRAKERSTKENDVRFTLHISGSQFLAASDGVARERTEAKVRKRPNAAAAGQSMDAYAAKLRTIFGAESGVVREFRTEQAKVEAGWPSSGTAGMSAAEATKCIEAHRASLDWGHPSESLYWITVMHGNVLTPEQIAAARAEFAFPIAGSYDEARRLAAAKAERSLPAFGLILPAVVFAKPDDFEGIIAMLMWVTQDVRGPEVKLISEKTWQVGDTTYWERVFEYKYFLDRKQKLQDFVMNAYRGLRITDRDRPAAERLMKTLEQASSAQGPFSLYPEHYYNLKFTVDMRDCQLPGYRNAHGYARDSVWFWKEMLDRYPTLFSAANKQAILRDRSPTVDELWVKQFPTHAEFNGQRLDHHHLGQGPFATPVPQGAHEKFRGPMHVK